MTSFGTVSVLFRYLHLSYISSSEGCWEGSIHSVESVDHGRRQRKYDRLLTFQTLQGAPGEDLHQSYPTNRLEDLNWTLHNLHGVRWMEEHEKREGGQAATCARRFSTSFKTLFTDSALPSVSPSTCPLQLTRLPLTQIPEAAETDAHHVNQRPQHGPGRLTCVVRWGVFKDSDRKAQRLDKGA